MKILRLIVRHVTASVAWIGLVSPVFVFCVHRALRSQGWMELFWLIIFGLYAELVVRPLTNRLENHLGVRSRQNRS